MRAITWSRWHRAVWTCTLLLSACSADEGAESIVGSGNVEELTTQVMFVERVTISLPFHTVVYNGKPRQLVVRGEDNLIRHVDIVETAVGKWKIGASQALEFEQHADVEIEIPYIDMVEINVDAEHVEFADDPATVWRGGAYSGVPGMR